MLLSHNIGFSATGGVTDRGVAIGAPGSRKLGWVTSDVGESTIYPTGRSAQFSFVCEGPAGAQVHAIGELSRAVVSLRL